MKVKEGWAERKGTAIKQYERDRIVNFGAREANY